ncbi:MAG: sugar ABC transporter ATP-binding protein [Christensenellaceae bacterium]|jgi:ribose transport system ATP-binding protein
MYVLEAKGIMKTFPGVKALQDVDFALEPQEIHALMGENGAGKSTLVKVLTGVYQADGGTITLGDKVLQRIETTKQAFDLGISVIHQELNLLPHLDVATNIYIGRLPKNALGLVDWKKVHADADEVLRQVAADFDSHDIVRDLSVSQQQLVEIAKSVSRKAKILFFDEPTSSLTPAEVQNLFRIMRNLKEQGITMVYISHKLDEIEEIADRITVMRDGRKVMTKNMKDVSMDEIISAMVGGMITNRYPKNYVEIGGPIFEVKDLNRKGVLHDINFTLRSGEILGITGLMGAGRTELARAIFGADPIDSGEIFVEGKKVKIRNVSDAINAGIGLLTEDRKTQGLLLNLSVNDNTAIAALNSKKASKKLTARGMLHKKKIRENTELYCKKLQVKTPSIQQKVVNLSGGNQQKVIIGKWLSTDSKILIFDEPTRGIDVGTKAEIYKIMEELAASGVGIIMISTELPETLGISDRVLVMRKGRIVAELDPKKTSEEEIVSYSAMEGIPNEK